jgi:flagella basal body P-ring formation protein FlgA
MSTFNLYKSIHLTTGNAFCLLIIQDNKMRQFPVNTMRSKTNTFTILVLIFLCISVGYANTHQYQSHESIMAAAESHLTQATRHFAGKVGIEISPLDHRLRLNFCNQALETFSPPGSNSTGKTTVGVRCHKPKPWTLYVQANVTLTSPVVISQKDITRGTVIGHEDISLEERDISSLLRGSFDSPNPVIGRTVKRSIRRYQVITPSNLVEERTIRRGQTVTILAGNENIRVSMKGKALQHGNPGDIIRVKNVISNKKLEARVIAAGIVRID